MTALVLALLLLSVPTDAPVAADVVVTHTAVLETPGHTFVARGRGLWLSEATALARARELDGYRARAATPPWVLVVSAVVAAVVELATLWAGVRVCERTGVCR